MRAELTGRRGACTEKLTLKRRSGKVVDVRERLELGFSRGGGVAVETLDCDEKVGFEGTPSGSTDPRAAAEAMLAALSTTETMIFILKHEAAVGARQFVSLTACLWEKIRQRWTPFQLEILTGHLSLASGSTFLWCLYSRVDS